MSSNEIVKSFFERAIKKYSKKDVECLLEAKLNCAGPLFEVIVNGIDSLGGICYGFKRNNSENRSIQFMKEIMGMNPVLSKDADRFVYVNVVELAYYYIEAIDRIAGDIDTYIFHSPLIDNNEKNIYEQAANEITQSADELACNIGTAKEGPGVSSSAYFPNNTFNIS